MIQVTQEDIDNGIILSPTSCPVARAIQRVHPSWKRIRVGNKSIEAFISGRKKAFIVTAPMTLFVSRFDLGMSVKPFSFELRSPIVRWVKVSEYAEMYRCSVRSVYRQIERGEHQVQIINGIKHIGLSNDSS